MSEQGPSKTPYLDGIIAKFMALRDQVVAADLSVFDNDETFRPVTPEAHQVVGTMSEEARRLYILTAAVGEELAAFEVDHTDRCGTPEGDADHVRIKEFNVRLNELKGHMWAAVQADLPENVRNNRSLELRKDGQVTIDLGEAPSHPSNIDGRSGFMAIISGLPLHNF